jgi:hypothetical protein
MSGPVVTEPSLFALFHISLDSSASQSAWRRSGRKDHSVRVLLPQPTNNVTVIISSRWESDVIFSSCLP